MRTTFVIQDEVQRYHWTQDSCSLHRVVIYTKCEETGKDLLVSSVCVISDDLEHDVAFVYATQKFVAQFLNEKCSQVESVHYFRMTHLGSTRTVRIL